MSALPGGLAGHPGFFNPGKAPGLACLDACFRYLWLNECLARINGLPVASHLGKPVDQVGGGPCVGIMPELLAMAATGARESHLELRWPSPQGGGALCYRVTLIAHRQEDGGLREVTMAVADTSHENAVAWVLAECFHEQQLFAVLAPRFAGSLRRELAHELRNRLVPLLTMAQMLKKAGELDPATLIWAGQSMEKTALELSGLASALQKPAALSAKGPSQQEDPVDLCLLVSHVLDHARPLFGVGAPPALSAPSHGAWVLGDPAWLIHPIMLCLLQIAREAEGVALEIQAQSDHCLLTMSSRRPGACAEGSELGRGRAGKSLGMGLMLVKMFVEEQGGGLLAHGMEGGGLRREIVMRLPSFDSSLASGFHPPGKPPSAGA